MALFIPGEMRVVLRILGTGGAETAVQRLADGFSAMGNADAAPERALADAAVAARGGAGDKAAGFAVAKHTLAADGYRVEVVLAAASAKAAERLLQALAFDALLYAAGTDETGDDRRFKSLAAAATVRPENRRVFRCAILGADAASPLGVAASGSGSLKAAFWPREQAFEALKALIDSVLADCHEGIRPWETA